MKPVKLCRPVVFLLILALTFGFAVIPVFADSEKYVVLDSSLKDAASLPEFNTYGCTVLQLENGIRLVPDGSNAYPFVTFGDSYRNYELSFETYGMKVGGGIVRSGADCFNHVNGCDGYVCAYDSAWMFGGKSVLNDAKTEGSWVQIKDGGTHAARLAYAEKLLWRITVENSYISCMVLDPDSGVILAEIDLTDTDKTAGRPGFRVKSGEEGCFSNLKVTVLGEEAAALKAAASADATTALPETTDDAAVTAPSTVSEPSGTTVLPTDTAEPGTTGSSENSPSTGNLLPVFATVTLLSFCLCLILLRKRKSSDSF
ncbi:MAG: hypothetical protein ACI4WZ_04275 [Eubacteriales bacterium]